MATEPTPFFEAYSVGLCYASVCTNLPDEETTRRLNMARPTGVSDWRISDEPVFLSGEPNGYPCPDDPTRRHVLFSC